MYDLCAERIHVLTRQKVRCLYNQLLLTVMVVVVEGTDCVAFAAAAGSNRAVYSHLPLA